MACITRNKYKAPVPGLDGFTLVELKLVEKHGQITWISKLACVPRNFRIEIILL